MKRLRCIALVATILAGTAATSAGQDSLEGLWVARQRYGPDVHGTLLILPVNNVLRADIAGYSVPVRVDGQKSLFRASR